MSVSVGDLPNPFGQPLWGFVTYRRPGEATDRAGVRLADGTILHVAGLDAYSGLAVALDDWDELIGRFDSVDPPDGQPESGAQLATPVRFPRKLLGAGANYASHVAEMGVDPVPPADDPFFFLAPPTTSVVGPGDSIVIPPEPDAKIDWEVELGVVIGRRLRHADRDAAKAGVAGWTIVNDISARGYFVKPSAPRPFDLNWVQQKALDTFFPIGPMMVPIHLLPDPHDLALRLVRNGVVEQSSSTAEMIIDSFDLVSAASRHVTLEPGDIIATGTPAGVGLPRNIFLHNGDTVSAEIESLGVLTNPVVAEKPRFSGAMPTVTR